MEFNRVLKAFLSRFLIPIAAVGLLLAPVAPASATTVTPVMIDLQSTGRGVVANISVTNTGAGPLPVEITVTPLDPTAAGFQPGKGSTDDLLVAPPTALIPAGQTQTFRVQWIGDPDLAGSRHFYVSVNQLPVKLPEGQSAVQIVYNFQVLVSVSSPARKPQLAIATVAPASIEGKPAAAVSVVNGGQAHGYISQQRLKLSATNQAGAEVFSKTISGSEFQQLVGYGLVASGQTRTVNVPVDKLPDGAKLSAVLMNDRAQ
jgi:P pilus assembly chaperone PapD